MYLCTVTNRSIVMQLHNRDLYVCYGSLQQYQKTENFNIGTPLL